MKFSKAIATLALSLGLSARCANAFTLNSSRHTTTRNNGAASISTRISTEFASQTAEEVSTSIEDLSDDFKAAREQTLGALKSKLDNPQLMTLLEHFTNEYFVACQKANIAGNESVSAASTAKAISDALSYGFQFGLKDKYQFSSTHTALRGDPETEDGNDIDFYKFGCDFFRPAIDIPNSVVLGEEALKKIREQIQNGENVVLLANHQSEADPQVVSCLFEKAGMGEEAENITYVAGHKVTTDTLAIPFSMGRNLICIHSKKHIDADPDTKPFKRRQNLAAMSGMLGKLKSGGTMIWVAPSGGRDRRDLETGKVPIAPFDQKTVDMFRLMGNKSKVPTHFYAFSMVSYDLCPPPDFVEAGTGEQRNVRFGPVAINVSDELENVGGVESRHLFTDHALEVCEKGYLELLEALQ
jgi:glycerol-3-phosphate O-acyltransferase